MLLVKDIVVAKVLLVNFWTFAIDAFAVIKLTRLVLDDLSLFI